VDAVHNGEQGLKAAREGNYAAVILDVMLPRMNGWDVLRELRRESQIPVLMLTALATNRTAWPVSRSAPTSMFENIFHARTAGAPAGRAAPVRALTAVKRESAAAASRSRSPANRSERAFRNVFRRHAAATATRFDLLLALAQAPGRVKSREQLLLDVADRDFEAFDRSIEFTLRPCGANSATTLAFRGP
jgi:DNA-binding response OmpR family regulator